ncbi:MULTISPECIES: LysR family transcriptional regulator [Variovorax]|jgi:DNA-binding transcriptional LysR family regulator|uniref:DNA-binding transcriptional LysR family regulator n=3 Tax=Variovorax paradoxus TaxID=34073 RepID=A0A0H2MPT4_VARPD|nr:LysR family transcriptional regulator [Variovorax paradoxus]AGU50188.1 transcriptional regulator, LysR family [Variovorax paradoxus B4]KLN58710.1 HTH-type transcriptional activator CmpR [Variovorax paradoxus]MBW8718212.1 LysR family transcriptional regulator [Variovorax paradoxus]MDP9969710.1 DNA-binding transcriptional LysR family regulator [Variovorax paradoxus]
MPLSKHASFRQLATFHAVARLGSVSLAADEMHLTQPAVSIQIGTLEESAGTPLLQRTGRGIRLTEAGELLAGYAGRILDLWREAGDEMAMLQGVFSGTLRVGAITTAEYLLPPILVNFAKEHPKVKVKLQVGNRDEIVRMLAGQEIDIAIMGRPPAELKTDSSAFAKHPMAFLAAPSHPLMSAAKPSIALLSDTRMLVRERGSGTRTTVERFFKDHGLPLRIGSELSSNEAIKQMCAAGFGIAFLSMHTCVLEMNAGLLGVLPVPGNPVVRDWYVMHLASRQLPQVALAFEEYLRTHGQAQIQQQLGTLPAARTAARKRSVRRAA